MRQVTARSPLVDSKPAERVPPTLRARFLGGSSYGRGCIDEWTPDAAPTPDSDPRIIAWRSLCPGWTDSSAATTGATSQSDFGRLQCGCDTHFGGLDCGLGCPDENLHRSSDYQLSPRSGWWLCGDFAGTSHTEAHPDLGPAMFGIDDGDGKVISVRGDLATRGASGPPLCEKPDCTSGYSIRSGF
ncbi:MAG: hypothetical protein V2A73_09515 [Pseudomonadota bacterium]